MRPPLIVFLLALALRAGAQDDPPPVTDAERAEGVALVASWTARDDALLGEAHYGLQHPLEGQLARGTVRVRVEAGPPGTKVAYRVVVDGRVEGADLSTTLLVDARLALVSCESSLRDGDLVVRQRSSARRPGGGWTSERSEAGAAPRRVEDEEAPTTSYAEAWLVALLARRLPRVKAVYELPGLEWVDGPPGALVTRRTPVVLEAKDEMVQHRGQLLDAFVVRAWIGDRPPITHVLDAGGALVEVRQEGALHAVVGEAAEVASRVPPSASDEGSVRRAAQTYFRVVVGWRDLDALDQVIDWEGMAAWLGRAAPADRPTPAQLRARAREEIGAAPKLGDGVDMSQHFALDRELERMSAKVTVSGSEATCGCPCGDHLRLRLRRLDRRWKITAIEGEFGLEGE